jgi:hypothetical protein
VSLAYWQVQIRASSVLTMLQIEHDICGVCVQAKEGWWNEDAVVEVADEKRIHSMGLGAAAGIVVVVGSSMFDGEVPAASSMVTPKEDDEENTAAVGIAPHALQPRPLCQIAIHRNHRGRNQIERLAFRQECEYDL